MEHALRNTVAHRGAEAIAGPATTIYSNGFENDLMDWAAFGGIFDATRVASGAHGIVSAAGGYHAESSPSGSACRWGGYNFGAGKAVPTAFQEYTTAVAIYLDLAGGWANGTRFDFDSAINNAAGRLLRDFIFNAGFYCDSDGGPGSGTARFLISAGNIGQHGNRSARNPGRSPVAIFATGWYTFEHHFYNQGGLLTVDMSIFEASSALVKTWTIRTTDRIAAVGGNGYGWFDYNQFTPLAFDNAELRTHTALS